MKKLLTFMFGDLGLFISATIMTIASWFLFPIFVDIVRGGHALSSLLGYILVCPFVIGFFLSSIMSGISLITRGSIHKNWVILGLGILVSAFDVVILILSLI